MDPAVQSYFDAIPETHRHLFDRLHSMIIELYPEPAMSISYGIPTYTVGRRRVYLGLWKGGVSLYAVPVEEFKKKHPSIKTGKGSLNFRLTDVLPEADIREAARQGIERD